MTPLSLRASPLAAAIRARRAAPHRPVWIHVVIAERGINRWCVLRGADHQIDGQREAFIGTLCCFPLPYQPVSVTTTRPHNTCPACETELAAGTPGAAVAVEPVRSRTITPRERPLPAVELDIDALLGVEGGAFDHLEDLREWER